MSKSILSNVSLKSSVSFLNFGLGDLFSVECGVLNSLLLLPLSPCRDVYYLL